MKIIKLRKKDYVDLESLLFRLDLVAGKHGLPDLLVVNQTTYSKIRQSLTERAKKEYPYLSKLKLNFLVEATLLNIGPRVLKTKDGGSKLQTGCAILLDKDEQTD